MQRLQRWTKNNLGQFIFSQLSHTLITAVILGALFFGAARVGALDGMLSPLAQTTGASFSTINYQGRLADPDGTPISDILTFKFSLYDAPTDGNLLWGPESHDDVPVSDGLFSVRLGQYESLPPTLFNGGDVWLEIVVKGETLSPREKLAAVPYAMVASEALTVPDGSITSDKLAFTDDRLDIQRHYIDNIGTGDAALDIGRDTNNGNMYFDLVEGETIAFRDNTASGATTFFYVHKTGPLRAYGSLNMQGNSILNQGAMVEANLQTPDELAAEQIERFSEGDVLCWSEDRLELCSQPDDPLVQAVADANGKPIVIGAEVIKVLGPVQWGDMLVASEVAGYAVAVENPAPGTVIAQALEDFDGEQGIIKAMIRKF